MFAFFVVMENEHLCVPIYIKYKNVYYKIYAKIYAKKIMFN